MKFPTVLCLVPFTASSPTKKLSFSEEVTLRLSEGTDGTRMLPIPRNEMEVSYLRLAVERETSYRRLTQDRELAQLALQHKRRTGQQLLATILGLGIFATIAGVFGLVWGLVHLGLGRPLIAGHLSMSNVGLDKSP